MSKAAIVDGHYVGVGLQGQVTIGICSPALSDMTGVTVDFFAVALLVISSGTARSRKSSQLITTRAGVEVDDRSSNGKVFVKSSTGP